VSFTLVAFDWDTEPATRLAEQLGVELDTLDLHRFPDGEILVTGPVRSNSTVIVYCSLAQPNEKLIALLFAVDSLYRSGASRFILVAPYMPYMRQDTAFAPGQAVSQHTLGQFVAGLFDRVITVDAHLHRTPDIRDVFNGIDALNLSAAKVIADYAVRHGCDERTVVVGPDEESRQWVEHIARPLGAEFLVGKKTRLSDNKVSIVFASDQLDGRQVLIADDIVSSGGTMMEAVVQLKKLGAVEIILAVTHGLFDDATEQKLREAGVSRIWLTDSVVKDNACVHLAPLLAQSLLDS
jgi:ribose-phosphate pyrophosphokinase